MTLSPCIGGKIIARETVRHAQRRDRQMLRGDATRKRKLLEKQTAA